jgi:hypothetical protein
MADRKTPKLEKGGVQNLRFYKHTVSTEIYFVNGFAFEEATMRTVVIYTGGFTGLIFTRPVREFESRFKLMEKKK